MGGNHAKQAKNGGVNDENVEYGHAEFWPFGGQFGPVGPAASNLLDRGRSSVVGARSHCTARNPVRAAVGVLLGKL